MHSYRTCLVGKLRQRPSRSDVPSPVIHVASSSPTATAATEMSETTKPRTVKKKLASSLVIAGGGGVILEVNSIRNIFMLLSHSVKIALG